MKRLLLSFAVLIAAHPVLAQKEVLRSHWEPGKLLKQETAMVMTTAVPGTKEEQKSNMTQTFEVRVTAEPATGNKLADLTITGMKGSMEMMGQTQTYDSADPAKSPPVLQQMFGSMVNKSFTLVFDKDDKYVETRGAEKLLATPLGTGTGMDGKQLADSFRRSFEMALPKDPVGVGDTWIVEEKMDMPPLSTVVKVKGKFDSIVEVEGRKHAKLLVEGTFSTSPDPAAPFTLGEGSKFSGEVLFDLQRRVIASNLARTEMNLQVQGQTVPMKQTVTTKLLSVEEAK